MRKIILVVIILSALASVASAETTTKVGFEPKTMFVDTGEVFNVTINVEPSTEIDTFAIDNITWQPGTIDCLSVTQGTLFSESTLWISGGIQNANGCIKNICWGSATPTSSSGSYVVLTFKAIKGGYVDVEIDGNSVGAARAGNAVTTEVSNKLAVSVTGSTGFLGGAGNGPNTPLFLAIGIICVVGVLVAIVSIRRRKPKTQDKEHLDVDKLFEN